MRIIPAIHSVEAEMSINRPSTEIPTNAILVIFDGIENTYTVYEQGDELPSDPVYPTA